jgi:hypothetical protein
LALALAGLYSSTAWGATSGTAENENAVVTATCSSVSVTYRNFPNAPNNKVSQLLTIHGVAISKTTFTFNGPTGTNESAIVVPPGSGAVDIHASWHTNGSSGAFDLPVPLMCPPAPALSIVKMQEIAGSKTGFTTSPLTGKIGQTVDYKIVVTNTGNVPLTFGQFIDEHCENVTGGSNEQLDLGSQTTYLCNHVLTEVGSYDNVATVTGTPPPGDGAPVTKTSNTVVVNVPPEPAFTITKLQEIAGSGGGFTVSPLVGEVGQKVDYEIIVTNTGNVPLTFGEFTDEHCEDVTGGPGETAVSPGSSTTYFCEHVLTSTGPYRNSATDTGTPPVGDGSPLTHTSNTVVVVGHPGEAGKKEGKNGVVEATCSSVSVTFRGFPNVPNNTVTVTLTIHGVKILKTTFTFNGPTGTDVFNNIVVPPGAGPVDIHASWNTNGFRGEFDLGVQLECPPEPAFSITKLQQIEGSKTGFTESELAAEKGQTVDYEVVVKNTGNVPLTFSAFTDEHCEDVTGGPGGAQLALGASTTYLCNHLLTVVGPYTNTASVTGAPPSGDGSPITKTSNTVVVEASGGVA